MSGEKVKMLTVKEVSEATGIGLSTINLYCRNGKYPNAKKTESPIGEFWLIPETDVALVSKKGRGRPQKEKGR